MGIPGAWTILHQASQTCSLTELAFVEGFESNRHGLRTLKIGVDASIWLNQTQAVFHVPGKHYQVGENPELRAIFYRLARFRKLPIHLVFVFDGEGRPSIKRGINVCTKAHALASSFQEMITSYGYDFHIAPAEAEAELAAFNSHGIIDAVLTDDVDALVFGATHIIRNPNVKEDGDDVKVYTANTIRSAVSLTAGGILLLAILCGGDYDSVGLRGCGMGTALALSRAGMGDDLLHAAQTCTPLELEDFLEKWRRRLRMTLRYNDAGHLSRRYSVLSNSIPDTFPNLQILMLYADPVTSWTTGQKPPNTAGWVPRELDLGKLAVLCERSFTWGTSEGIMSCFQEHVWPGMALYGLVENSNVGIATALATHLSGTITEGTFCLSSILRIVRRQKGGKKKLAGYVVEVQTGNLSARTRSGLRGLRTFKTSVLKKREVLPGKMVVWIPRCLLKQALPLLVATYEKSQKNKTKLEPTTTSGYQKVFSRLAATPVTAMPAVAIPGSSTENAIYVG